MQAWPTAVGLSELAGGDVDISDKAALKRALAGASLTEVIHLAGISFVPDSVADPLRTYQVNFIGTLNLLECLREIGFSGRFILSAQAMHTA
jgi:GDP-4-dehydro-6-deoxy-D-mannose reductase